MALKLKKALSAYDRVDETTINCGGEWLCAIKSFSSVAKIYAKEQARVRAKGGLKKAKGSTASVSLMVTDPTENITEENPWMFGSFEADLEFFIEYILVGWTGLKDDDGNDVPYSKETALELFLENGKVGEQLYAELLAATINTSLFLRTSNAQAEEDGKN